MEAPLTNEFFIGRAYSNDIALKVVFIASQMLIFMHRSNRNFNIPPAPGKPRALDYFLCPGSGNLTFTWVGWGKLNQKCQASNDFLFRAPKSLIAINTCLDEIEEFKGRDRTFVSDWLTKKGLQKL